MSLEKLPDLEVKVRLCRALVYLRGWIEESSKYNEVINWLDLKMIDDNVTAILKGEKTDVEAVIDYFGLKLDE